MTTLSVSPLLPPQKLNELASRFKISEDEIKMYVETFQAIDVNQDGQITADELRNALIELGYRTSLEQAKRMVDLADENSDGTVDLPEFLRMIIRTAIWLQPDVEEEILAAFKIFDKNSDGYISINELHETMAKMGQPLTKKEAEAMLKTMDSNDDGKISYKEFMTVWTEFMAAGMQPKA